MWPDRVSNPGPPTYESGALPIALRGPALIRANCFLGIETGLVRPEMRLIFLSGRRLFSFDPEDINSY